ncbi:hypothetical protein XH86_04985 [Bradyrhizobium guangdongense]|uniref:Uncharacterized protein n=1 Tax=Bradyrhizobium guangdongense TaxID=1325090 RepID=A0ABX6UB68_9BRAD|nr:hypothetical protein X265_04985 [Bradyrhizobium guangdongense]QOZ58173.1 hypothetical protein XH86_04985 [Bradyrhizobium guangdongense]
MWIRTNSLRRHCEELLRRSNPGSCSSGSLDCFAALAMTAWPHAHPACCFASLSLTSAAISNERSRAA